MFIWKIRLWGLCSFWGMCSSSGIDTGIVRRTYERINPKIVQPIGVCRGGYEAAERRSAG
ncbi:hypothetical protein RSSM_01142 [Rhodopirellula sallentina SM41]|uniref:Uncharacterized protein n=1 Tax=Rhodopirellula sallentina SM41 TaxID=1263870 RepID=M5U7L6_9BACT|nr:hypothetical protein RSSM_01142 [Rhodopirellula sallentina SM41]